MERRHRRAHTRDRRPSVPHQGRWPRATLTQPELLLSFVVEAGGVAEQRGDVLHLRLDDVTLLVRADEGRYVVEQMDRGVVEGTDLDTTSRPALDRFLALSAGQSWRSRNRLRPLRAPSGGISEVTVRADGPGWSADWTDLEGHPRPSTLLFFGTEMTSPDRAPFCDDDRRPANGKKRYFSATVRGSARACLNSYG